MKTLDEVGLRKKTGFHHALLHITPHALIVAHFVPHAARLFGWPFVDFFAQMSSALLPPEECKMVMMQKGLS